MASFFTSVRQGLNRTGNRNNAPQQPGQQGGQPGGQQQRQDAPGYSSGYGNANLGPPRVPPLPSSPSLSSSIAMSGSNPLSSQNTGNSGHSQRGASPNPSQSVPKPLFLNPNVQQFIVKGNYMTLAATPKLVEAGEWLAHQIVMQYQLLCKLLEEVQCVNENTGLPTCNHLTCPSMSAGTHTWTWLDNNRQPLTLPASQYISLVQKWISGKIHDTRIFPTDISSLASLSNVASTYASGSVYSNIAPIPAGPTTSTAPLSELAGATTEWLGKSSGFPEEFQSDCKALYRQMMRIYAHLYWAHFKEPFYDLNNERHLNSSFTHFVTVGTQFDLLTRKDVEPMESLLEMWVTMKIFPVESKVSQWFGSATQSQPQNAPLQQSGGASAPPSAISAPPPFPPTSSAPGQHPGLAS